MQDFALSSQNCGHWVLQLIAATVLPGAQERSSQDTNRPYLTCTAPPWASPHPCPWPRTPSRSAWGHQSLSQWYKTTPVASHASRVDPVNACCSSSPAVSLVPALFASGWPPWFITCPVGAVGKPHDQPQFCSWAQSLQDGVQSALTPDWTKSQQKVLKMLNCTLFLIWKSSNYFIKIPKSYFSGSQMEYIHFLISEGEENNCFIETPESMKPRGKRKYYGRDIQILEQ